MRFMHHSRFLGSMATVLSAGLLLAACGGDSDGDGATSGDTQEKVVIKFAAISAEGDIPFVQAFQDEVTEKTDGAVTFENYWSASLLGVEDMVQGLQGGVAEMGQVIPTYYPQDLPVNAWIAGMGAAVSTDPTRAVAAQGAAAYDYLMGDTGGRSEYEDAGLEPVAVTASPAYHALCTKPVEDLADAAGLRARSSGPMWTHTAEALGMISVDVAFTELYDSLQRGVVDCALLQIGGFHVLGLDEVASHFVPVTFAQLPSSSVVMNGDFWDQLTPETQAIIHEASATFFESAAYSWLERQVDAANEMIGEGNPVTVDEVSPELLEAADASRLEWVEGLPSTAPAGVDDPEGVVAAYQERIDYWNGVMDDLGYPQAPADVNGVMEAYRELDGVDLEEFMVKFREESVSSTAPSS